MILGRNPALWVALGASILNALVVLQIWNLDTIQLAALNALLVAAIGVIANEADPTTAGTFAATTQAPTHGSVTTTE